MRFVWGLVVTVLAGCGMLAVGPFPRTSIPAEIAAAPNQKLELVMAATGVQVYRCEAKKDAAGQFDWVFQAPEAVLRDASGQYLGRHYAGPTWEGEDGSKVVGTVEARLNAPARTAIPWLRLGAKATGAGILANVTTVQRVGTVGGQPPAGGCTQSDEGRILRVEYTADYNFYVPR